MPERLNLRIVNHAFGGQHQAQPDQHVARQTCLNRRGEKHRALGLYHHQSPVVARLATVAEAGGAASIPGQGPATFRTFDTDGALLRSGQIEPAVLQARFDTEGAHLTIRALRAANRAANPGEPGAITGALILIALAALTAFGAVIGRGLM